MSIKWTMKRGAKMLNSKIERYFEELAPWIDDRIDEKWGHFNKICPNCLKRDGHNKQWCNECGALMVDFSTIKRRITNREWISSARNNNYHAGRVGTLYMIKITLPKVREERKRGYK